jgi:hypothetical protein
MPRERVNDIFNKATRLTDEQRSQLMQWLNQIQEAGALSRRINDVARDFSDGGKCRVWLCVPRLAVPLCDDLLGAAHCRLSPYPRRTSFSLVPSRVGSGVAPRGHQRHHQRMPVLFGEVIKYFCPSLVDVSLLMSTRSVSQKGVNWTLLTKQVLPRLSLSLPKRVVQSVTTELPGHAEVLLFEVGEPFAATQPLPPTSFCLLPLCPFHAITST